MAIVALFFAMPAAGQSHYTPTNRDLSSIQAMFDRYFQGIDKGEGPLLASAFTDDGRLAHVRDGKVLDELVGRQALVDFRPPPGVPILNLWHFMTNSRLDFQNPTYATHYAYWLDIKLSPEGVPTVGIPGHFEDILVKQKGEWLIKERKVVIGAK